MTSVMGLGRILARAATLRDLVEPIQGDRVEQRDAFVERASREDVAAI
jgi:hypothetical protein